MDRGMHQAAFPSSRLRVTPYFCQAQPEIGEACNGKNHKSADKAKKESLHLVRCSIRNGRAYSRREVPDAADESGEQTEVLV